MGGGSKKSILSSVEKMEDKVKGTVSVISCDPSFKLFKGTVSVISCDPSFKLLTDHWGKRTNYLSLKEWFSIYIKT